MPNNSAYEVYDTVRGASIRILTKMRMLEDEIIFQGRINFFDFLYILYFRCMKLYGNILTEIAKQILGCTLNALIATYTVKFTLCNGVQRLFFEASRGS